MSWVGLVHFTELKKTGRRSDWYKTGPVHTHQLAVGDMTMSG